MAICHLGPTPKHLALKVSRARVGYSMSSSWPRPVEVREVAIQWDYSHGLAPSYRCFCYFSCSKYLRACSHTAHTRSHTHMYILHTHTHGADTYVLTTNPQSKSIPTCYKGGKSAHDRLARLGSTPIPLRCGYYRRIGGQKLCHRQADCGAERTDIKC